MTLEARNRRDESLAAIRAVAALLGAAGGFSDEARPQKCALIVRPTALEAVERRPRKAV